MIYSTKYSLRFFVATIFCLMILGITSSNYSVYYAAAGDSTIDSVVCPASTEGAPVGNQIDFTTSCTVNITVDPADSPVQLQVQTAIEGNTTTSTGGNGSDLDITSPENRFFANTTYAITQAASPVTVETGITGNTTLNLTYKTWEADIGDTSYNQTFALRLLDSGGTPVTQGPFSSGTTMTFTTANIEAVNIVTPPTVALANSAEVFSQNTDYDSNSFTVQVKANNTWILKNKLSRAPKDDGTTEEIAITSNYFRCNTSADYDCLNSSKTQFGAIDTYYNVAQNNAGDKTTGTSDSKTLSTKDVVVIYTTKTATSAYIKGSYTSTTTLQVTTPYP